MSCTPKPNGFADHYPYEKWLAIIGKILNIPNIFRQTHILLTTINIYQPLLTTSMLLLPFHPRGTSASSGDVGNVSALGPRNASTEGSPGING